MNDDQKIFDFLSGIFADEHCLERAMVNDVGLGPFARELRSAGFNDDESLQLCMSVVRGAGICA